MLFDPRSFVPSVDAGQPGWSPERQPPVAERRPAHDFLTLPSLADGIPHRALVTFGDEADVLDLVRTQFATGVLRASDVTNPASAGDAFAQAMFAWLAKRMPTCRRLNFSFSLIDTGAAREQLMQFGWDDQVDAPLFLAIDMPGDDVYFIGDARANALRAVHPHLLYTAMSLINSASAKSVFLRTPDVLLDLFARWYWEYDPTISDDDEARAFLTEHCGMDAEDVTRYLPSTVRPELAPDDVLPAYCHANPESRKLRVFGSRTLRELARGQRGWIKDLCVALAELNLAIKRQGSRSAIAGSQWAEPAYAAATLAYTRSDYVTQVLDDLYDGYNCNGDATMFQCFIPIAGEPKAIREQFEDLSSMLQIVDALDRVITLISD
ncbi:PRTRC system protein F [Cupriavidus pauculus]|uniref:PRTRC system protein F n=1 Tax=Cupriavidus pauculus TaxID=82633 RepID=A0A3G8H9I1_9BURK|nr:PRTRC system protein F [Cupriavidus pauculus]AZG17096.1 PRTRC system protein F [Cupriavidus pauculus]